MRVRHGEIYRRYINGETDFRSLGREYGVTGERIRQVVESRGKRYKEHPLLEAIEILGECEDELRYSTRVAIGRIDDSLLLKYNALVKDFMGMIEILKNIDAGTDVEAGNQSISEIKREELLNLPIEDLDLSVRAYNVLKRAGITTVEEIMEKTPHQLKNIRNIGQRTLAEIINKLQSIGLLRTLEKYNQGYDSKE